MLMNYVFGGIGFLLGTLVGFIIAGFVVLAACSRLNLDNK